MQSLAASLSNLPIDTVLGIDPCYCSDFAAAAPAVDTGMQRHNDTCTAATMSTPDIQGHGKAGTLRVAKLDNHHAALQTPGTASKQAADHTQKHTAGTANDGLDQHSSLESNSEQGYAADQQPATTKKQQHHDLSGTERPVATSTSGYTAGSDKFASNGKTENDSRLQTKPEATQVQQTLAHKTSAHDSAKAVAQATPVAKPGLETHDDELDKMLNSHNLDAVKSTSTVVQHLDKQEQGSLEDWLDSL